MRPGDVVSDTLVTYDAKGQVLETWEVAADLDRSAGLSDIFDSYVEAAVRRFQARNGISADGVVRESTVIAMNVPAAVRLRQLEANIVRVRAMAGKRAANTLLIKPNHWA